MTLTAHFVYDGDCRLEKGRQYFGQEVGHGHIGRSPLQSKIHSAPLYAWHGDWCRSIIGISETDDQQRHHHTMAI